MFHACGWTYPWANVFAFATQVSSNLEILDLIKLIDCPSFIKVTIRAVANSVIWKHFTESGVTHYCGAPTVQVSLPCV
jgi:hypothetical protein